MLRDPLSRRAATAPNEPGLRRLAAASIILASGLATPLDSRGGVETTEASEQKIRTAIENWRSAFNARDEEHVCDLFATDLVANYKGEPERDYSSLCETLRRALRDRDTNYTYSVRISEVMVYGASAVVRLVWTLELDKAGSPPQVIEEQAVDMFRRQTDGSWKISRYLAYPADR